MQPIVRVIGKILRLVGISSPEDSEPNLASSNLPSWRSSNAAAPEKSPAQE